LYWKSCVLCVPEEGGAGAAPPRSQSSTSRPAAGPPPPRACRAQEGGSARLWAPPTSGAARFGRSAWDAGRRWGHSGVAPPPLPTVPPTRPPTVPTRALSRRGTAASQRGDGPPDFGGLGAGGARAWGEWCIRCAGGGGVMCVRIVPEREAEREGRGRDVRPNSTGEGGGEGGAGERCASE